MYYYIKESISAASEVNIENYKSATMFESARGVAWRREKMGEHGAMQGWRGKVCGTCRYSDLTNVPRQKRKKSVG